MSEPIGYLCTCGHFSDVHGLGPVLFYCGGCKDECYLECVSDE